MDTTIMIDGVQKVISEAELSSLIKSGFAKADSMIWRQGWTEWRALSTIPELLEEAKRVASAKGAELPSGAEVYGNPAGMPMLLMTGWLLVIAGAACFFGVLGKNEPGIERISGDSALHQIGGAILAAQGVLLLLFRSTAKVLLSEMRKLRAK